MMIRAYAALAVAIAGIAWSAIFVRWADVPGTVSAFYRVLIAGAVLISWRLARKGDSPLFSQIKGTARLSGPWVAVAGSCFYEPFLTCAPAVAR
jgi:drug/metabolite transporter (DMT)-like permease